MATVETGPALQTNGQGAATFSVENPATGATIASVPNLDAAGVKDLVARARAAQPAWEALGFDGRAEVMYELRRWVVENRERVAQTLSEENGKPPDEALLTEIFYVCDSLGLLVDHFQLAPFDKQTNFLFGSGITQQHAAFARELFLRFVHQLHHRRQLGQRPLFFHR